MLVTQSCPTLCDPMDCSLPGSSVHEIFQARILEWVAISFSRGSSQPRDWTQVSCTADRFFTDWATTSKLPRISLILILLGFWFWKGEAEAELEPGPPDSWFLNLIHWGEHMTKHLSLFPLTIYRTCFSDRVRF